MLLLSTLRSRLLLILAASVALVVAAGAPGLLKAQAPDAPEAPGTPDVPGTPDAPSAKGPNGAVDGQGPLVRYMSTTARVHRARREPAKAYGVFEFPEGSRAIVLEIENTDAARYSPPPELIKALAALRPGTLVRTWVRARGERRLLLSAEPHALKPGEDEPHSYVFGGTRRARVGRWDYLAVTLRRFGAETVALLPNRTVAGESRPDERLTRHVAGLKPGDVVRAQVQRSGVYTFLADVFPYVPVVTGEVVRLGPAAGEARPGRPALELRTASGPRTLPIPTTDPEGRPLTDPLAALGAGSVRAGQQVRVFPREDADGRPFVWRVELLGEVRRFDEHRVDARFGDAGVTLFRKHRTWYVSAHTYGADDDDGGRTAEKVGLARLMAEPALRERLKVTPAQFERLKGTLAQRRLYTPAEEQRLLAFRDAYDNGTPAARAAAIQEVYGILHAVAQREREHDAARSSAVKAIVTPEQYRGITDAGREAPPVPAPVPPKEEPKGKEQERPQRQEQKQERQNDTGP